MSHEGALTVSPLARLGRRFAATRPWVQVATAAVLAVSFRLPLLGAPAYRDEGGYLLVAHYWHSGGPYLYGSLFVDRPPLLLTIFRLADALGGLDALRVIGTVSVVVTVAAAGWAGWLVGGSPGARWSAFAAAALGISPLLGVTEVDGELLAAPLVLLSCAFLLAATRPGCGRLSGIGYAMAAGACAMAAILVKQNFVDAVAFAFAYLAACVLARRLPVGQALRVLGLVAAGAAIPAVAAGVWASTSGTGVGDLWFAMYGIRWKALQVLNGQDLIPSDRLHSLELAAVESGMVSLAVIFVVTQLRTLRRLDPLVVAIATMLGVEVVGVALGANFYLHYLIQVVPSLVLASGWLATTRARTLWWGRVGIAAVLVSAVCFAVSAAIPPPRPPSETAAFETWIHAAAHPGDSLMITYGNANLFQASGLRPAYFNLWSLPMRVLDPNLEQLSATLAGPGAPTWMVEWDPFDMLGAGPAARLQAAVDRHFHQVADICGHQIFQLDGTRRALPAGVASCGS